MAAGRDSDKADCDSAKAARRAERGESGCVGATVGGSVDGGCGVASTAVGTDDKEDKMDENIVLERIVDFAVIDGAD